MKRILIALAVLLAVQVADAQTTKTPAAAKKAVESAKAASENPKKEAKVATWLKLADAYMAAYNAPAGSARSGCWPPLPAPTGLQGESDRQNPPEPIPHPHESRYRQTFRLLRRSQRRRWRRGRRGVPEGRQGKNHRPYGGQCHCHQLRCDLRRCKGKLRC